MDDPARQPQIDEAHRAIGRYFARFSQLVFRMRYAMSWRLTSGHDPIELGELAFAGAAAQHIADSFFLMCRFDGSFDDDELDIAGTLRDAVNAEITYRNYYAHGDWWIGGLSPGASATTADPELIRMLPRSRKGDFADLEAYAPAKLNAQSEQLLELVQNVAEFGALALGHPVVVVAGDGLTHADKRHYRVKDVFAIEPGRSGTGGQKKRVTRTGPKAAEIVRVAHYVA